MKKPLQLIRKYLLSPLKVVVNYSRGNAPNLDHYSLNKENNHPGIILGFDDYHEDNWKECFDLFDKYQAKVVFFVMGNSVTDFMLEAQSRGHEIGYHTASHPVLNKVSREQFFKETTSPTDSFRKAGVELTSFAYPHGIYEPWMNTELLKTYKTVRGTGSVDLYTREEIKKGFVKSISIDNIGIREPLFHNTINYILNCTKKYGRISILMSHDISDAPWGTTPQRLEYILKKIQEFGLPFYTFKDLQ